MRVPYRALSRWVVITASGVPTAQRPPADVQHPVDEPGHGGDLVGDEHDGDPVLAVVLAEQPGDRLLRGRVEGQQRLVAEQQPRPAGQSLGDPQPLLLPTGQQPDRRIRVVLRADRLNDAVDLAGTGPRQAPAVPVNAELDQVPARVNGGPEQLGHEIVITCPVGDDQPRLRHGQGAGNVGLIQMRIGGRAGQDRSDLDMRAADLRRDVSQKFSPATTFTTPGVTGARGVPHPASMAAAVSTAATSRRATPAHLRSDTAGRKRRSRRLLVTTNTELNAIAAPAISGFRNPRAASGMAAAL